MARCTQTAKLQRLVTFVTTTTTTGSPDTPKHRQKSNNCGQQLPQSVTEQAAQHDNHTCSPPSLYERRRMTVDTTVLLCTTKPGAEKEEMVVSQTMP